MESEFRSQSLRQVETVQTSSQVQQVVEEVLPARPEFVKTLQATVEQAEVM